MFHMLQPHLHAQRLIFPDEEPAPPPVLHSHPKAKHSGYLREKLL